MYQQVWNYLRGDVELAVDCPMPERVFNICAAHGILFWDVRWQSERSFTLHTTRCGAIRLKATVKELPVTITVRRERGAELTWHRLRGRYVLLCALAALMVLLWCGSRFIWDFEVTGNDTVPEETILRALEKQGITLGSASRRIDQETLRNHLLLELQDISWIAVNVSGCVAHVQVVERHRPPQILSDRDSCNIVAAKAGLVTKVEALDGQAQVAKGTTVTAGQLLISGVVDSDSHGLRMLHGLGSVYARTWYDLSVSVPLQTMSHEAIQHKTTRLALICGKQRINFWGRGSVLGNSCDKITLYRQLKLPPGVPLPLTLVREQTVTFTPLLQKRTAKEAQQEGEAALVRYLQTLLQEDGTVVAARFSATEQNGYLLVTLRAECCEQIGVSVPIE